MWKNVDSWKLSNGEAGTREECVGFRFLNGVSDAIKQGALEGDRP
jgi:hypothetical protein